MDLFLSLWEYNRWANSILLDKLEQLGSGLPVSSLRLMSHIVNAQSVYHRAQINMDLRQRGFEPAPTDYIIFIRVTGR